jgi:carbamoyl-phosphate synthase large subunit
MTHAVQASPDHPVLVDKFLEDAIEVDVDAIADGTASGHRRHHGAHRGGRGPLGRLEPACCRPTRSTSGIVDEIRAPPSARRASSAWSA